MKILSNNQWVSPEDYLNEQHKKLKFIFQRRFVKTLHRMEYCVYHGIPCSREMGKLIRHQDNLEHFYSLCREDAQYLRDYMKEHPNINAPQLKKRIKSFHFFWSIHG